MRGYIFGEVMTNDEKIEQLRELVRPLARAHFEKVSLFLKAYFPGITCTITETLRSSEDQAKRFASGVSKAKPGQSAHEYGLAWDICLIKDGKILPDKHLAWHLIPAAAGIIASSRLVCGADFSSIRDMPHTEYREWRLIKNDRP